MKKILPMLLMTVMLRVWWPDNHGTNSGIVVGSFGKFYPRFIVRTDDGTILHIADDRVTKSKWIEVKAEK